MLARSALLVVSILVLVGLLGLWWTLKENQSSPSAAEHQSIFSRSFDEPALQPESSSDELLALAKKEIAAFREGYPKSALPWNVLGDFHYRTTNAVEAEAAWKNSLKLESGNQDALFGLANLAFEAGRFEEATALCEAIKAQKSDNPRVPLLLADGYLNQDKPQLAVLTLEQHIASQPSSVQALEMLGSAKVRLGEHDVAIQLLRTALQFDPNSTKAHYELGQAFLRKKDRENAKIHLDQFKALSEREGESTSQEAQQFLDRDNAVSVTSQALADLAVSYRSVGAFPESEEKMLMALQLVPDRIEWLQELLSLYRFQKLPQESIDVLMRLAEQEPQNVDHLLAIGGLYSEMEQAEPAVEYFRKAIAVAPNDPRCVQAQEIIDQQLSQ